MSEMEVEACCRTDEDVLATLTLSKLNPDDLSMPSQTLYFSESASDQNHILIQLNKDVLKSVEDGEDIVIRGNSEDSAILCTGDKTYDIKKAKISNTLLFLPECRVGNKEPTDEDEKENINTSNNSFKLIHQKIEGWSHDYLELKQIHPRINKLKMLLQENPYKGPEAEEECAEKNKYKMSEFLNIIQASEGELVESLHKLGACCIDGYWRVLDFDYLTFCLSGICEVIDCESWHFSQIPLEKLCEKINDSGELVPDFIVHHILSFYGHRISNAEGVSVFEIDEEKFCRYFAELLMHDTGKYNLQEFLEVWKSTVPSDKIVTDEKYLSGLALIDRNVKPETIERFSVDSLPQDPSKRFDALFQKRAKWTREEIEPFISDLCLEGQSVSALLTKFARSSISNGAKLFSSRKSLR